MKKSYVIFDFLKLTIPGKVARGRTVFTKMTSNPFFATPDVSLDELKDSTDELENSFMAAEGGGKEETSRMHKAEEAWDENMRLEARYVERVSKHDGTIILSAGFNIARTPTYFPKAELIAENGEMPGTVWLKRQAVPGAKSYLWQYCIGKLSETEEGWINEKVTTQASTLITGVPSVTRCWFRVATVSPEGTSAYCDPIMHVVA